MTIIASNHSPKVILASASKTRATLLKNAGIDAICDPAYVDEDAVKNSLAYEGANATQVAETLAELKATTVSHRHKDAYVIGADQTLDCDGVWFDKPEDMAQAKDNMKALRGKTHHLNAAVAIVKNGQTVWHYNEAASLTMRDFSNDFLDYYLGICGEDICLSVGGYQLEGAGSQLFSSIQGDYFTILGLPLLPLLDFFRHHGVVRL